MKSDGAAAAAAKQDADPTQRPEPPPINLVVVTLDTLRADHLGCYGYFRDTSPHLDAFAKESLLFRRCYAPISHTTPSHASLFLSVNPIEHGVLGNAVRSPEGKMRPTRIATSEEFQTLAQRLQRRGWRTGGFVSSTPVKRSSGLALGFDAWNEPASHSRYARDAIEPAIRWIESLHGAPFFLWVHLNDAHSALGEPNKIPADYATRYKSDDALRAWIAARALPERVTRIDVDVLVCDAINDYDGAVRWLDEQLAVLFERLHQPDLWPHTVLVVTADHGQGLGQHGSLYHGLAWREQLEAPLMIRVPGHAPGESTRLLSTIDILPTTLGLAPAFADESFLRQCQGGNVLAEDFDERPLFAMVADRPDSFSCMTTRWHFIHGGPGKDRLFDLVADPFEIENVAADHPKIVAAMLRWGEADVEHQRRRAASHATTDSVRDEKSEADLLQELKALGYATGEEGGAEEPPDPARHDGDHDRP